MDECFLSRPRGDVLSETLAEETIIIDLADGRYFRVRGLASDLWEAMGQPIALGALFARAEAIPGREIARYLIDLEQAGLIAVDAPARLAEAAGPEEGAPGTGLVLEIYDDMTDLLLLDPVHDVTEAGWPARVAEG